MSDNQVKTAIAEMYELMGQYADFGASDTEPRGEFAQLLADHLDGVEVRVPATASEWQLFSDMEGSDAVAQALNAKAHDVVRIANSDHRSFVEAMRYYF
jgi:hypothetical protein